MWMLSGGGGGGKEAAECSSVCCRCTTHLIRMERRHAPIAARTLLAVLATCGRCADSLCSPQLAGVTAALQAYSSVVLSSCRLSHLWGTGRGEGAQLLWQDAPNALMAPCHCCMSTPQGGAAASEARIGVPQ